MSKDKKPFSFIRSAIKTTEIGIKADCEKNGTPVPQGRDLRKLALQLMRSSMANGSTNDLGSARD